MTERTVLIRLKASPSGFNRGLAEAALSVRTLRKEIDTTNDRTAWLVQGLTAIAPALVPLGAAAVPVLSGLTTQLTVAASAAGVLALGLNGIGDALKSVDAYQLDPTTANLEKMNQELARVGPQGAVFVEFLDSIQPRLRELQLSARGGMLPGFQEGISSLLTQLPMFQRIIEQISAGLGTLGAEAGAGLAGPGFRPFFEFLENEARPTLLEMGRTAGNFAEGLANMIVAFYPVSAQFTSGFEDMSEAFANWSAGLGDNSTFQAFLAYVQESGPKAMDLLGSLVDAFVQIVEAAAPVGDIMLPALTGLLDVVATLANTPLASVFIAAASAMAVYGRAAALARLTTSGLGEVLAGGARAWGLNSKGAVGFTGNLKAMRGEYGKMAKAAGAVGLLGVAASGVADSFGLTNTVMGATMGMMAGPWGAAVGGAIGLALDFASANKSAEINIGDLTATLDRSTGAITANTEAYAAQQLEASGALAAAEKLGISLDLVTSAALGNETAMRMVNDQIAMLQANRLEDAGTADFLEGQDNAASVTDGINDMSDALGKSRGELRRVTSAIPSYSSGIGAAGSAAAEAAAQQARYNRALERTDQFLSRRGAARAYEAALDDATDALRRNGRTLDINTRKGRENAASIDDMISSTKTNLTEMRKGDRQAFLTRARRDELDMARKMGASRSELRQLRAELKALDGMVVNAEVRIKRSTGVIATPVAMGAFWPKAYAMGDVRNNHQPEIARGGDWRVWAEPETQGESYIPHANDHRRPRAKSIMERTAGLMGGSVTWHANGSIGGDMWSQDGRLVKSLITLGKAAEASSKALERETKARDALRSKRTEIRTSVAEGFRSDPFATGDDPWAEGSSSDPLGVINSDIRNARSFAASIKALKDKGYDGAALEDIISRNDAGLASEYAGKSRSYLNQLERAYAIRERVTNSVGASAADAVVGDELADVNKNLRDIKNQLKLQRGEGKANADRTGNAVAKGVNGTAAKATRDRNHHP